MKITGISTDGIGPLGAVEWSPGESEVLYDDNQRGKTTLIDVVIHTLFKERMKLFEPRYDSYEGCEVGVQLGEDHHTFGEDGNSERLSELLEWNMPELHRFLCIRASDLSLSRPLSSKGPEEIWKALSSVMSGMNQEYLQGIHKSVRRNARLTKTLNWRNRGPDGLKDQMNREIAPNLERAERAEDRLRELMDCRRRRREARTDRENLRDRLSKIEEKLERIERRRVRAELDRADDLLGEIRSLNNDVEERFGDRIVESFLEPWEEVVSNLSDVEDSLEDWREALDRREQINELDDRLGEIEQELTEAKEKFSKNKEVFIDARHDEIRPLYHRLSESVASREQWLPVLEWSTPGFGLSTALLVVGIGLAFVEWLPGLIVSGAGVAGFVALVSLVVYRRRLETTIENCRERANELTGKWPGPDMGEDEETLDVLMDVSPSDVFPELAEEIEKLESKKQTIEGERSALADGLDKMLDDLDENLDDNVEAISGRIEQLETERDGIQSKREEYRRKTGVPDLETFRDKLSERRDIEQRIDQKVVKLTTLLDLEDDENLGVIRSTVERKLEEYSDVTSPESGPEELEKQEDELESKRRGVEEKIEEAEDAIESAEETERSISSELSEIGIPFDRPEELFRKEHDWEEQLEEAVLDRLAGALCLQVIDEMEGDYMGEIRRLLDADDGGRWSINELYGSVMGTEYEVDFDVDEMAFEIHRDGTVVNERALSSGARSHLYLSCRLAVLQKLFPDDPGFMILDDPFLHYYPDRKEAVVEALEPMVEQGWQILLFTVDPASRDLFEDVLGADVKSVEDLATT